MQKSLLPFNELKI